MRSKQTEVLVPGLYWEWEIRARKSENEDHISILCKTGLSKIT